MAAQGGEPALAAVASGDYMGDAVCAGCHPDVARLHAQSRHASTMHLVSAARDGALFRSRERIADQSLEVTYAQTVGDGQCLSTAYGAGGGTPVAARYAMGSGRYGITYLGLDGPGSWYEMRLTYYTRLHRWDYTPFLQPGNGPQNPLGLPLNRQQLAFCYSCHVTTTQIEADGMLGPASHIGIGCERCHGPGAAHVRAARGEAPAADAGANGHVGQAGLAGQSASPPSILADLGATRATIMTGCSACHSGPPDIPKEPGQAVILARFAATALEQSRCYQQSGTLTCLTCHDAHSLAAAPRGGYEAACMSCHSLTATGAHAESLAASAGGSRATVGGTGARDHAAPRTCPVSPRTGCIRCHMPVQSTRSFALVGFHNHWIKVYDHSLR